MRRYVTASKLLRTIVLRLAIVATSLITVAVLAMPAMSDSADQSFAARLPSLGEVTVTCGLAKSVSTPYGGIAVTKFDNNSISYPVEAFAIVNYRGEFAEAHFPGGSPTYWEQTPQSKKGRNQADDAERQSYPGFGAKAGWIFGIARDRRLQSPRDAIEFLASIHAQRHADQFLPV